MVLVPTQGKPLCVYAYQPSAFARYTSVRYVRAMLLLLLKASLILPSASEMLLLAAAVLQARLWQLA